MKAAVGLLAALLLAAPSTSFFKYQRAVQAASSGGQHYLTVDETLWQHARLDLSDLRLYAAEREIPYTLEMERGSSETQQKECRVLQPATLAGATQFLLDMSCVPEYDRVTLRLAARNFVAHARVAGQDDPHGARWAVLGTTTLYDLSQEKLGHNSTLQLPPSEYKYLRVIMDGSVKPSDLQGATAGITRESKAVWRSVASDPKQSLQGKDTVLTFSVPKNVPVERVVIEIGPAQPNFRRDIEIHGDNQETLASGELSRIHMQRSGQKIDVEQTSLPIYGATQETLRAVIHNGDDLPLKITGAHLEQYERRMYFDSAPETQLNLYYGDDKLAAPVYDYAKLFQKDAGANQIQLGPQEANAAYTGRPDERPWSERHPAVLWAAIMAAVLILGALALKSMRTAAA
jgi:hypothetical protein